MPLTLTGKIKPDKQLRLLGSNHLPLTLRIVILDLLTNLILFLFKNIDPFIRKGLFCPRSFTAKILSALLMAILLIVTLTILFRPSGPHQSTADSRMEEYRIFRCISRPFKS